MAVTLIGGTILTLLFLPALYALWFKIRPPADESRRTDSAPTPAHA